MPDRINLKFITVVRNDVDGLIETINSLINLANNSKDLFFSVFIQDGLSTDMTIISAKSIIDKNEVSNLEFFISSESDNGIFDAMNKPLKFLKKKKNTYTILQKYLWEMFGTKKLKLIGTFAHILQNLSLSLIIIY